MQKLNSYLLHVPPTRLVQIKSPPTLRERLVLLPLLILLVLVLLVLLIFLFLILLFLLLLLLWTSRTGWPSSRDSLDWRRWHNRRNRNRINTQPITISTSLVSISRANHRAFGNRSLGGSSNKSIRAPTLSSVFSAEEVVVTRTAETGTHVECHGTVPQECGWQSAGSLAVGDAAVELV